MKFTKKIIAVIMAVVVFFTITTPVFAKSEKLPSTKKEYIELLNDEGYPAITTAEVVARIQAVSNFFRLMTNGKFPTGDKINISFDKFLTDANIYVLANSGIDMESLLKGLPPINRVAEFLVDTYEIDTVAFREEMLVLRDKARAEGSPVAEIYYFIGAYMSIIDKIELFAEPTDDPAVFQVCFNMVYRDGAYNTIHSGMLINSETGEMTNNNGAGMLGLGFNFSFKEMVIYTVIDAWTRNFGFAVTYDVLANLVGIYKYVTQRYHFDYDGLEWMIQIWKGTYFYVTNGAEIGIYNRVPGEEIGSFYNCANDDQMMEMQMKLSIGDKVLINTKPQKHWWLTGFHLSGTVYNPESLTMVYSITFPNDTMLNAFIKSLKEESTYDVTYTTNGTKITVNW